MLQMIVLRYMIHLALILKNVVHFFFFAFKAFSLFEKKSGAIVNISPSFNDWSRWKSAKAACGGRSRLGDEG